MKIITTISDISIKNERLKNYIQSLAISFYNSINPNENNPNKKITKKDIDEFIKLKPNEILFHQENGGIVILEANDKLSTTYSGENWVLNDNLFKENSEAVVIIKENGNIIGIEFLILFNNEFGISFFKELEDEDKNLEFFNYIEKNKDFLEEKDLLKEENE